MHEIGSQYNLIQDTLQRLVDGQNEVSDARSTEANAVAKGVEFKRDKREALAAGEFESAPNLLLAAYPLEPVSMRGLFDATESGLIDVLHSPPRLRGNGWDMVTNQRMENIHGRLRRGGKPGWKLLQLSRDGTLIFLARGDDGFLSWSLNQKQDDPFLIVPFVLAHSIYAFALFAPRIFEYSTPRPRRMKYMAELRNMENAGKPAMLHPHYKQTQNSFVLQSDFRSMPYPNESFSIEMPFEATPGEICYELIAKIFEWFGLDRDQVPFTRVENGKRLIDDLSLFS